MIRVKMKFGEEKDIVLKGLFLEGEANKIYKNASLDNRVFLYFDNDGEISWKTKKEIKVYEYACKSIRETEKDKIHLYIKPYIFEWEIIYYQWMLYNDRYKDEINKYRSTSEYKISNIYVCNEKAMNILDMFIKKAYLIGSENKYPCMLEKRIEEIMENCISVNYIEKEKVIGS